MLFSFSYHSSFKSLFRVLKNDFLKKAKKNQISLSNSKPINWQIVSKQKMNKKIQYQSLIVNVNERAAVTLAALTVED